MSALNKIYHKYMWFLEHMENHRSSCGRSGRSWSHGTDCSDNQCWHKASQAAGGAGDTLCMCFSGLSQDCWHDNQSSFFPPSFHALYCFLQRTVRLTSLPSVMLQVQLQFLWSLEIPGNLETNFFFSDSVETWWTLVSSWLTYVKGKKSPGLSIPHIRQKHIFLMSLTVADRISPWPVAIHWWCYSA